MDPLESNDAEIQSSSQSWGGVGGIKETPPSVGVGLSNAHCWAHVHVANPRDAQAPDPLL